MKQGAILWEIYDYSVVKDIRPKQGQLIAVRYNDITTQYGISLIGMIMGYDNKTIAELRGDVAVSLVTVNQQVQALASNLSGLNSDVTAHKNETSPHSSTATPTANRLALYDGNKRLKTGADAVAGSDVTPLSQVNQLIAALKQLVDTDLTAHKNETKTMGDDLQTQLDAQYTTFVTLDGNIPYTTMQGRYYGALEHNILTLRHARTLLFGLKKSLQRTIERLRTDTQTQFDATYTTFVSLDGNTPYTTLQGCYYQSLE